MNWSAQQRRLLDALGYEVLALGRPGAAAVLAGEDTAAATFAARAAESPPPASAPSAPAAADSARLFEATRRAAGGADPSAHVADFGRLRLDPALKRALWPKLRALRRSLA